ncbi:MAG TPA: ATP-binding cassette domain-containing protein [Verrucomicrobiae bacterium]|nr:ATP-binding cassette domain-containing protein [Verrucomicrobiae bacterium]
MKKVCLGVEKLTIRRGSTVILDGVDWSVRRGQHWVILGANGSGKTSLLSALTGYMTPTAGRITVLGRTFGRADWRELRLHIGIVSSSIRQLMANDEPALFTVASGKYAMIDFWGKLTRRDKSEAERILRQIDCAHLALRTWQVLSQGERQRILIGRALMAKPALLILDEPCAGLDPVAREHFLQFVDALGRSKNSPTIVFVTHHVEEIMPVFSHVLLLRGGRVLAAGPKEAVLTSLNLRATFDSPMRIRQQNERFTLSVSRPTPNKVI